MTRKVGGPPALGRGSAAHASFDWSALQSFLAVARAGRLTAAARTLRIDHSTLSRRIAGLEQALAVRLFDRQMTGYALTPEGTCLLASAQAMESAALTAVAEIGGAGRQVAGIVRVGAPEGFGTVFLAPRLAGLGQAHDGLAVELVAATRASGLANREVDIAVGVTRPEEGRLQARRLTDFELGLYVAPSCLAVDGPIRGLADFERHRLIGCVDDPESATPDMPPALDARARSGFAARSLAGRLNAALAGHGVALLPCFVGDACAGLVRVLATSVAPMRALWLAVHADLCNLARVRVTADFIAGETKAARRLFLPSLCGKAHGHLRIQGHSCAGLAVLQR